MSCNKRNCRTKLLHRHGVLGAVYYATYPEYLPPMVTPTNVTKKGSDV